MNLESLSQSGNDGHGAQGIGNQAAASGAELDQPDRLRAAHRLPAVGEPEPQKLAEDLRDFGGGGEIAVKAQGVAAAVIAVRRMLQRFRHVSAQRDRALRRDDPAEMRLERCAILAHRPPVGRPACGGTRRARQMSQAPNRMSGRLRICPMLMMPPMSPR